MGVKKSNFIVRGGADFSVIKKEIQKTQSAMTGFKTNIDASTKKVQASMSSMSKNISGSVGGMSKNISGIVKKTALLIGSIAAGGYIKDSINELSKMQSALTGLNSVANGTGHSFTQAQKFVKELTSDGLLPATDAITAYKNLLSRGYDDSQIQKVLTSLKDAAAFGRQAGYSYGDAIRSATEGLKNENSVLVDNAGVTKNVAQMWDDYAKSIGKTRNSLTQQEKIQAEVQGIIAETKFQMGDAAKYANTFAGQAAGLTRAFLDLKIAIGGIAAPIVQVVIPYIKAAVQWVTNLANTIGAFVQSVTGKGGFLAVSNDSKDMAGGVEAITGGFENVGASAIDAGDDVEAGAKKAKGALAGFDEINKISMSKPNDNSPDDSNGAGAVDTGNISGTPSFNIPKIEPPEIDLSWMDTFKQKLKELTPLTHEFIDGFVSKAIEIDLNPLESAKNILANIMDGIRNGIKKIDFGSISANLKTIFNALGEITANALNNVLTIAEGASKTIGAALEWGIAIGGKGFEIVTQAGAQFMKDNKEKIMQWQNEITETVANGFNNITTIIATLGEIIYSALSEKKTQIANTISDTFTTVSNTVMLAGTIIADTFEIITQNIADFVTDNKKKIKKFVDNLINIFTLCGDTVNNIVQGFLEALEKNWNNHFKDIVSGVSKAVTDIVGWFLSLFNDFIYPIIERALNWLNHIWEDSLKGIVDEVLGFVGRVGELLVILWESKIKPIFDFLMTYVVPVVKEVFLIIVDTIGGAVAIIGNIINSMLGVLNGLIDFLIGVFTGDWSRAWSGITKIFESSFEGMSKIAKNIVNSIINTINSMLRLVATGINNLIQMTENIKIPGTDIGLNIPKVTPYQIPKLAKGGVVAPNNEFLAILGDNKHETEIVSPLSTIKQALYEAMDARGNTGNPNITIEFTGEFADFITFATPKVIKEANKITKQRGVTAFNV